MGTLLQGQVTPAPRRDIGHPGRSQPEQSQPAKPLEGPWASGMLLARGLGAGQASGLSILHHPGATQVTLG